MVWRDKTFGGVLYKNTMVTEIQWSVTSLKRMGAHFSEIFT